MTWKQTYKYVIAMLMGIAFMALSVITVYADDIGNTGNTGQGNISGSNVYTFYYNYNSSHDAIELTVKTKKPIVGFGNTTSHTYSSPSDKTVLSTSNPRLGRSLDDAISDMIRIGGYQMTVAEAKAELTSLGYYDKGNGIWKTDGGYLTYVSAVKIRKKTHTISYDANGGTGAPSSQTKTEGTSLTLRSEKPSRTGYTFQYWTASIGGTYYPGGKYTHDQDGGTVTMKATWADVTSPTGTITAVPNSWSAGNGTVTMTVRDQGTGLNLLTLQRYSYVTGTWSTVAIWNLNGTTASTTKTYTETREGVFSYKMTITDQAGNSKSVSSKAIYLDHSAPNIQGTGNTVTTWTKVAPTIRVSATDSLMGTTYQGSGVKSLVIKDASGVVVGTGTSTASYTLSSKYQGICRWTVEARDWVNHITTATITTRYDATQPECLEFQAIPNVWSAGNGTVTFTVRDPDSGLSSILLERYSYVTQTWTTVKTWGYFGTTSAVTGTYTETKEGVFCYRLTATDVLGNAFVRTSDTVYLDHSAPVLYGLSDVETDWTNIAPMIRITTTDYLSGTSYQGSGVISVIIRDDAGVTVASGSTSASYTVQPNYEGVHTWYVTIEDAVGHIRTGSVTTKYDITKPGLDGNEVTEVVNGVTHSGYCQDNIIDQHIDDEVSRSTNGANLSSGLKSVILYLVTGEDREVIYSEQTRKDFAASDTHSFFDLYYEIPRMDTQVSYYEIIVTDFAGNRATKKLTSQYSLLSWFHTSIDRSSYGR